jgi:hypothetical protein
VIPLLLGLLTGNARAQACVCSRNIALPTGSALGAGSVILSLEGGYALTGNPEVYDGVSVTDRLGNSMANMYMPPHRITTASLSGSVGLTDDLSLAATVPWMQIQHPEPSEMPGDVGSRSLADAEIGLKWGRLVKDKNSFYGLSAAATLPTGKVVEDSPVRSGRGTTGVTGGLNGGTKLSARAALAASLTGSTGFGADEGGYAVGPSGGFALGTRYSPRENGPVSVLAYGLLRWAGLDRQDALIYQNTGFLTTDLSLGASWTFWSKDTRSAGLLVRGQVPIWQVVGDPMYTENFGASLALSATVL